MTDSTRYKVCTGSPGRGFAGHRWKVTSVRLFVPGLASRYGCRLPGQRSGWLTTAFCYWYGSHK
jgi:hypothetical protein